MIRVQVTADAEDATKFLVAIEGGLEDRRALNEALAERMVLELKNHFDRLNARPSKLGGRKTDFWKDQAENTGIVEVTDAGGVVGAGTTKLRFHVFGGVVKPVNKKFLTIPLIKEARGMSVDTWQNANRRKALFRVGRVLAVRDEEGGRDTGNRKRVSLRGKQGYKLVGLRPRTKFTAVFALAESATIKADPQALPDGKALAEALQKTADRHVRMFMKGGAA